MQRLLQNGVCDSVDRQFKGLEQQWNKIQNGQSFSELIPELFTLHQLHTTYDLFTENRNQLENNQNISGWIQMVFGGQTPNLTYPEYTIVKEEHNTPYTSPDVLKTLFYGQQPL